MRRLPAIVAVVVPLLVMAAWTLQEEWLSRNGELVELKVTGYDPRDLLAGHYLTYSVDYGSAAQCERAHDERCLCLRRIPPGPLAEANWIGNCEERPAACDLWIRGECRWQSFHAPIERFYIPESFSSRLATVPRLSTIRVRLNGKGGARVTGFFVDGVPLLEYAAPR